MNVCAVIPARNEGRTIRAVASSTRDQVSNVIVIDDGSVDDTVSQLSGLDVSVLRRPQAGGKAAALADGFKQALSQDYQWIVTLDGDGQHDPKDIGRLLEACQQQPHHLILGARVRHRDRQPRIRKFANKFADFWISWASGQRVPDSQTGFRVYPRELLESVKPSTSARHGFVYETAMLIDGARAGFPCLAVAIDSLYLADARPSYFRPAKDVWEIVRFVAKKILMRGGYPQGLWRAMTRRSQIMSD
jgi:glycosyltransferase involved in cell wall biosynthesis